jgi:hypothetical protein
MGGSVGRIARADVIARAISRFDEYLIIIEPRSRENELREREEGKREAGDDDNTMSPKC